MKLLFCEVCGDIVAPHRQALETRSCNCQRHTVWWVDPSAGVLRVNDRYGHDSGTFKGWPFEAKAWVLGLHNAFLGWPYNHDADSIKAILDATPDSYIFKTWGSVIIRIRPGESGDTRWAALPGDDEKD